MRKLIALILTLSLALGLGCACAEQDNFLISDWMLLYTLEDNAIDESVIFIYDDNTFEIMTEDESKKGTWTFDGETLALTGGDETMSLKWIEDEFRFKGEYGGMNVTMYMSVEPEEENQLDDETVEALVGLLSGGWMTAEDPAITDEINNILFQALDDYQTGTVTVAYTPYAYLGSQVVAGMNHAILCQASEINNGASWVIVFIYEDLQGNATVMNIVDFDFGSLCTYGAE